MVNKLHISIELLYHNQCKIQNIIYIIFLIYFLKKKLFEYEKNPYYILVLLINFNYKKK